MSRHIGRRDILKLLGSGAAASLVGRPFALADDREIRIAGRPARIMVSPISAHAVRITIAEIGSEATAVAEDGALVPAQPPRAAATARSLRVQVSHDPLTLRVEDADGHVIQTLRIDADTAVLSFPLGDAPVLGLGEGGPQFDRRGNLDPMRSGQGGYRLRTHGGRVPVQWLLGTGGWALFIHQPLGGFDLTGAEGKFGTALAQRPNPGAPGAAAAPPPRPPLPLDLFVVDARDPAQAMAEYARITGHPEMPPLWSLGYQQSHRTLASREEILGVGKTFRDKKLPCDAVIYLGTGFCPSGWNTENGSFQFNARVFNDPKAILDEFHAMNFKVVLHSVILTRTLRGTVHDPCSATSFDASEVACLWDAHRKDFALGVDGWWPDEGDPLDAASRLTRNRMYYEGPQLDRPNQRPYALHRNGYAGMQRYASFLWSGDVYSTWETLRTHVPIAINTGLSGIPLWGTDTGGFVPTREFTGELYVRWFQFSAFCPLFRSHGRSWKLRLPWQWNTGDIGPNEVSNYGEAANPDPSELHNAEVEPICKRYLELRYRMLPYLYSAVRESCETGLPIVRALWLHYSDDRLAVARGDQYLWGRDILVAPVTEKGATSKSVYLPRGGWYDFWTEERLDGGREISRPVELATLPLFVRAGSIVPLGPVKQHTAEKAEGPLTLTVYPGADAACVVYEDDGASFRYRAGEWTKTEVRWHDGARRLSVRQMSGIKAARTPEQALEIRVAGEKTSRTATFRGRPLEMAL